MTTIHAAPRVPVEEAPSVSYRVAVRTALVKAVADAGGLPALRTRPTRRPFALPALSMFDYGDSADLTVPLFDRSYNVDVWATDLDQAESIAKRLEDLLDHQPLALAGDEGQVAFLQLVSDRDQPMDDAEYVRKTLVFRTLVYAYNGSQPFGG